ncbi:MAG: HetZ-related protein 2 [Cyanobacteria bacterium P01_E01_bin.42]
MTIEFARELETFWEKRLLEECADRPQATRQSIALWLLGEDRERFADMDDRQKAITRQAIEYRYRILHQRYLGANPDRAYRNLISRLGALAVLRNKIRTWVSLSRDRQRAVADVLQEVIQEMIESDRYIQATIGRISRCSPNPTLRNSLLLASIEEYCMRPIRNQPLLAYRFTNYLRRVQKGGMTQVPQKERIKMISEEIAPEAGESPISLLDSEAIATYQMERDGEEQQVLREEVRQEFEHYLAEKVDPLAVEWLRLYLQGHSQEAIAKKLDVPIKQIYRLREKINYHAVKIFALKSRPDLVASWLKTSIREHNLGLTPNQWQGFWQDLTPVQQKIIDRLKEGKTIDEIAKQLNLKKSQVMSEWSKSYQQAQTIRN